MKGISRIVSVVIVCGGALTARADVFRMRSGLVSLETVPVGNAGNPPDTRYGTPGYGGVDYPYSIGKYEVTAGQYTEFLNAVAATDLYHLYSEELMYSVGCRIQRSGFPGSYTYSVAPDWANRPVNLVDWGDAARFANWLHNGQPTGPQGPGTTEDGSYFLNGATGHTALLAVTRSVQATWVMPTEDEWYKAAYHNNDGVTANYWDYATGTNALPSNDLVDPDPGNNANFRQDGYTIGSPYYRTAVGEFEHSPSRYGTFDQCGNISEWNEGIVSGGFRGVRGGCFFDYYTYLPAWSRDGYRPGYVSHRIGFRVALVPEPATLAPFMVVLGSALCRRWN